MTTSGVEPIFELLAGCRAAVREEIEAVRADLERRNLAEPVPASAGRLVPGTGLDRRLYEFQLGGGSYDVRVDDAVRVETESVTALATVTRFDRGRNLLAVATDTALGPRPGAARLTFDPTWLLEALDDRLHHVAEDPGAYSVETALRLFGRFPPRTGETEPATHAGADLNDSQRRALARVAGSDTQFVWGPPGTGKTRLLACVAGLLAERERVCVAAATNAAVDEAAARIVERLGPGAVEANRVIRFGAGLVPGSDERLGVDAAITRAEAVRPSALTRGLDELSVHLGLRRLSGESIALAVARARASARETGEPALEARAARLAFAYQAAARGVLGEADIVLCTLARLAVRDELATGRFDALLVDEASSAPLPYVLFAACLARTRAVVFGDFQQLPPVVASRGPQAERWLRRDLFRVSGLIDGDALPSARDTLCAMLDEQYRMRPAIRALIGDLFYGGRLRDATPPAADDHAPGEFGRGLAVVDTAGLDPSVERVQGSRRNETHLEVLLRLLETLGRSGISDVAVVTPYRVQARELRRRVRTRLGRLAPAGLEIATIHRFQGREKRVIVFDTVDAPPSRSWFMDESRNADFPRLLNVALSRSRDLLIVVATVPGLRDTLPADALLNRVVDRIRSEGVAIDARRIGDLLRTLEAGAGVW